MQIAAGTDLLLVGRVIGTHGLQGELKIVPESDDPARVTGLKKVWLGEANLSADKFDVSRSRLHRTKYGISVLMYVNGVSSISQASQLRGRNVYAQEGDLPKLETGEYFLHDLIGAVVSTEAGDVVGELKDIWSAPASDIYVVRRSGQRDALIPAVPAIVTSVDAASRQVVIQSIEGLLD